MTSKHQLLVVGVLLAFSAFVFAPPPPSYEVSDNLGECQRVSDDLIEPALECFKTELSQEMINETRRLFNTTTCLPCKHFCRKQQQLRECLSQGVEIMKDISNKSKTMVPFTAQLIDTTLHALCDNPDEMFPVVTDEERLCFRNSTDICDPHLEFIHYMEVVAFCDSGNPDTDPLTEEYICRKVADFLDCTKENVTPCSDSLVNTISIFKTKLLSSDSCSKYN